MRQGKKYSEWNIGSVNMYAKLTLLYSALALLLKILIFTFSGERDLGRSDRV